MPGSVTYVPFVGVARHWRDAGQEQYRGTEHGDTSGHYRTPSSINIRPGHVFEQATVLLLSPVATVR